MYWPFFHSGTCISTSSMHLCWLHFIKQHLWFPVLTCTKKPRTCLVHKWWELKNTSSNQELAAAIRSWECSQLTISSHFAGLLWANTIWKLIIVVHPTEAWVYPLHDFHNVQFFCGRRVGCLCVPAMGITPLMIFLHNRYCKWSIYYFVLKSGLVWFNLLQIESCLNFWSAWTMSGFMDLIVIDFCKLQLTSVFTCYENCVQ
jgi:hypothetical protein